MTFQRLPSQCSTNAAPSAGVTPKSKDEPIAQISLALSAKDIWAIGSSFDLGVTPADGAALVEHWDGNRWNVMTAFDTALVGRTWATAFFSNQDIWGVVYT